MREELHKKLLVDFPWIFRNIDTNNNYLEMCWSFSVGDGWYDIIRNICEELTAIHKETGVQFIATQVKEKFGTLRFYTMDDNVLLPYKDSTKMNAVSRGHHIISEGENRSNTICEWCGNDGNAQSSLWIKTLCDPCQKIRLKKGNIT